MSDMEREVLGAILFQPEENEAYLETLTADDFFDPRNRAVFSAVKKIKAKGLVPDLPTVTEFLPDYRTYLTGLVVKSVVVNMDMHVQMLKDRAAKRKLAQEMKRFMDELQDPLKSADEIAASAVEKFTSLFTASRERTITEQAISEVDLLTARAKRGESQIKTSLQAINDISDMLEQPDYTIIAARPAAGKTALMLQIAVDMALQRKKALIFSLEMTPEQLIERMIARFTGIPNRKLRKGKIYDDDWEKIAKAVDLISSLPIKIDEEARTAEEIYAKALKVAKQEGVDVVFVDYVQFISTKEKFVRKNDEIAKVSKTLADIKAKLHVPVIALAQLNRAAEAQDEPSLANLKESGQLEQDADNVLILWDDDEYVSDGAMQYVELYIRKYRNGETGKKKLAFNKDKQEFWDVVEK
ncbi:replicative DNA helicase [Caldanaerobius fijiensis DSM 17918]|uniref:DNA 5'-3' helicase n=1 Tax=Caldanaerobius fijiensis DSM 17918 TaxID=1121256 RepID=A0A1M5ELF3_9THEO|nr:replicative DNA helicase [Caldanaerobius fijiensis]SHF79950.1 replicative DNA helicase [Caldanaerobius fijiensis DSM 17918]